MKHIENELNHTQETNRSSSSQDSLPSIQRQASVITPSTEETLRGNTLPSITPIKQNNQTIKSRPINLVSVVTSSTPQTVVTNNNQVPNKPQVPKQNIEVPE